MQPVYTLQVLFADRKSALKSTGIRVIRGINSIEALGG